MMCHTAGTMKPITRLFLLVLLAMWILIPALSYLFMAPVIPPPP